MENKKTKLTISGTAKKSLKSIEIAKNKGKNSTVFEKSKSNLVKKGSSFKTSGNNTRPKSNLSFNRGATLKPLFPSKTPPVINDFEISRNVLDGSQYILLDDTEEEHHDSKRVYEEIVSSQSHNVYDFSKEWDCYCGCALLWNK